MRRMLLVCSLGLACVFGLGSLQAAAQQGTINPRIPPPPPPPEPPATKPNPQPPADPMAGTKPAPAQPVPAPIAVPPQPPSPPTNLPASVPIPAGTKFSVVLDTPLSTRISHQGQRVTFRTSDSLRLADQLEIPPDTSFTGTVVEVRKPGGFGKSGSLKVRVEHINLSSGAPADVLAHLDSPDMKAHGKLTTDRQHSTDLYSLVMYTIEGTLVGTQIGGGKGAAIGAGAGAAAAIIIAMAHKGQDLYLEPGMPFQVILDKSIDLPGNSVWQAQQSYALAHAPAMNAGPDSTWDQDSAGASQRGSEASEKDPDRPKLKRRPKVP